MADNEWPDPPDYLPPAAAAEWQHAVDEAREGGDEIHAWATIKHLQERHKTRKNAGILTWAEMLAIPPLDFLVEDLLPTSGLSILVGHPKAGKSTLARVLAAEIAGHGHKRFLDREVRQTGQVLYFSPDEHPSMTTAHFRHLLPPTTTAIDFLPQGTAETLHSVLTTDSYALAIIDTLGKLCQDPDLDGNDYMGWQRPLEELRDLATTTGCHICLLHHARKSEGSRSLAVLGSAAIAGAVDTILSIQIEEQGGQYVRHVESTNRAGRDLPRQRLVLHTDGWLTAEPPPPDPKAEAKAEAVAMRNAGHTVREIATALGVSRSTAHNWTRTRPTERPT